MNLPVFLLGTFLSPNRTSGSGKTGIDPGYVPNSPYDRASPMRSKLPPPSLGAKMAETGENSIHYRPGCPNLRASLTAEGGLKVAASKFFKAKEALVAAPRS